MNLHWHCFLPTLRVDGHTYSKIKDHEFHCLDTHTLKDQVQYHEFHCPCMPRVISPLDSAVVHRCVQKVEILVSDSIHTGIFTNCWCRRVYDCASIHRIWKHTFPYKIVRQHNSCPGKRPEIYSPAHHTLSRSRDRWGIHPSYDNTLLVEAVAVCLPTTANLIQ